MEISPRVEEFMTASRLSAIQLRDAISIVPGAMGEDTPMMGVINHVFFDVDMHGRSPEALIMARKHDLELNELSYWVEKDGALDENAELHCQVSEREFHTRLEELDSPRYCLKDSLGFCDLLIERLDVEMAAVQAEVEDLESAKVGIADDITAKEADIANFRNLGWLQQRRRRRQLWEFLRGYRDLCRNALLVEACYQIRTRCIDILGRIKALVESEQMRTASLISEISSFVNELADAEEELEEFDYDCLVPNGKVLLEQEDLDFYFAEYRPLLDGEPISDRELAEGILTQLYRRMDSMRDYVDRVKSDIGPTLFGVSDERFRRIEALGVENVLEMKYVDNEAGRDISRLMSELSTRISESGRFLKISSLEKTGQDRRIAIRCISVRGGENSRLAREWLPRIVHKEPWNMVEGFCDTEITFYQAEYAYPMYSVTTVQELQKAYRASSRRKSENIFHLYPEYAELPEIIPFNHKQALEVFHKAAALGILSRDDGSGWVYSQNGKRVCLGGNRGEILGFLSSNQKLISELNGEFRGQLLREGITSIMPKILSFAEEHKDGDDIIDAELLQGIMLRLDEEFAN